MQASAGSLPVSNSPQVLARGDRMPLGGLDAGLVDTVEVGIVPILLGEGIPLVSAGADVACGAGPCTALDMGASALLSCASTPLPDKSRTNGIIPAKKFVRVRELHKCVMIPVSFYEYRLMKIDAICAVHLKRRNDFGMGTTRRES